MLLPFLVIKSDALLRYFHHQLVVITGTLACGIIDDFQQVEAACGLPAGDS